MPASLFDEPSWIADGGARLRVHRRQDDAAATGSAIPGATGGCCFPASPPTIADMIRAALALHEATGERAYLDRALAWQARARPPLRQPGHRRLFPHRRRRRGAGRAAELDQRRRDAQSQRDRGAEPGAARGASPATQPGATRPTGCSTACCRCAGENLFGHVALLNALDLRLRGAEIVVTGAGARPTRWPRRR